MVYGTDILLPEGAGKEWDEKQLLQWEYRANEGREWEGRSRSHHEHGHVEEREGREKNSQGTPSLEVEGPIRSGAHCSDSRQEDMKTRVP